MNGEQGSRVNARARTGLSLVTPSDVVGAIFDQSARGRGPAEIERRLKADKQFRGRVPTLRTIKKYVARAKRRESEAPDPWTLADANPDDVGLVVPVVAAVIEGTGGHVSAVSKTEAALIVRIVRAAPDIEPWDAFRLARRLRSEPDAEPDVQAYLSFAPWRGERESERYARAYADGLIREAIYRYVELAGTASGVGTATGDLTVTTPEGEER